MSRVRKAYSDFHGVEPAHIRKVNLPNPPKRGWVLGRITEVRYAPYYLEEPGLHKGVEFRHKFTDTGGGVVPDGPLPILVASDDGYQLLIVRDNSRYRVTRRGIVG